MVLSHQEDYLDEIDAFNDCLMDSLREMYDRACLIYSDMIKHKDYGDEIKLEARLFFSRQYPEHHPIQGGDRQLFWIKTGMKHMIVGLRASPLTMELLANPLNHSLVWTFFLIGTMALT